MSNVKLKLFTQESCPKCPAAKKIASEINNQCGIPVEYYAVDTVDGLAEAQFYVIKSTPSFVFTNNSDTEIKMFLGTVPTIAEIAEICDIN